MRYRFIQPGNEDEFEEFCVRYYRQLLKRGSLVRYAKRGEKQDGIDIIDQLATKPLVAIQCKHREPTKSIPPKEIKHEVSLAEGSSHSIDRYIIATTAKKSRHAQDTALKLNQRPNASRPFTVEIHFWEDICTRLGELGRAVAEFILDGEQSSEELLESVQISAGTYASTSARDDDSDDADLYPEISKLFEDRKLEAAEHEISKLPDPGNDTTLGTRQRYAILRFKGKLALERLQFDEAVRLFNLAFETCPDLQQAQQNHVLALEFSGERKQAFAEAARLLDAGTKSSHLASLLIRNSSEQSDLTAYQDTIDEFLTSDEDVNLALVGKYLDWNQLEFAYDAARRALQISPKSAHAHFSCGMVAHNAAIKGDWKGRRDNLAEAIGHYTDALSAATRDHFVGLLPEIHTNRGRVYGLMSDVKNAADDFRNAVRVADIPSLYAEAAVSYFLQTEDYDSAWDLMPLLDADSDEAACLTIVTEYQHASNEEKKNHILEMERLADRPFDRATEARFHCIQWAIELKDLGLARQCVPESFIERQAFQGNTLLGWIEAEAGNEQLSRERVALALDSSSRSATQQEIAVLARLLMRLGEDEKALPLLEQAATPGVLDDDCKRLVECAQRLDRQDTLLRICSELRQTNQQDNLIRRLEVQLLSHYAPDQAYSLAKEFREFDEPYFAAAGNFLAVRLRKLNEIDLDDQKLPSPDDFAPDEAYLIVTPYIAVRRYRDAIEFAYHQLRKHFSVERAHGQYMWLLLQYGEKAQISDAEVIDEQSAVRLENLTTGEQRWVVAEDRQPDAARNEFSSSNQVIRTLIGKRIGDVVDLRGPSIQLQQEQVAQIQSKFVRLFQDVVSNFQHRFPGAGTIQSIHLGSAEHFDPKPIIESHEQRRQQTDEAIAFYHSNLCSLHLLASRLGLNERRLITVLTGHEEWFVRSVQCTPESFLEAGEKGIDSSKIVLDLSAIVSISRLGVWDQLDRAREYLVSRATSDTVAAWMHELTEQEGQPTGYSSLTDDGQLHFQKVPPEELERERDEIKRTVKELNDLCSLKNSIAITELAPKLRDEYTEVCGFHTLEALSIARDENAVIWTDDLLVGVLAEADFGLTRIWTQLAFKVFENSKCVESRIYSEVTAKLTAWNYISTVWNPEDVVTAGSLCDWDANAWPFHDCIQQIGKSSLAPARKARIAVAFFRLLRRSKCIELKQSAVVQATLDALGNARHVEWMLQRLDQFFRVDYPSAEFLKHELSYWLRLR